MDRMQQALIAKIQKLDQARADPRNYALAQKLIKELVANFNAYELSLLVRRHKISKIKEIS